MSNEQISNLQSLSSITAGVNLTFNYAAGEAASRFLIALRDEKRIYGTRCPRCGRVLVPARSFCSRCYTDTSEWVEVGPRGTLIAYTPFPQPCSGDRKSADPLLPKGEGRRENYGLALIHLDGADTNILHLLSATLLNSLAAGTRVEAVFAEKRSGSVLDIAYFRPVSHTGDRLRAGKGERDERESKH